MIVILISLQESYMVGLGLGPSDLQSDALPIALVGPAS